ncbi:hypothetical protein FHU41_000960 [Psychromicrobium silvestre]|uniref:Methylamine utilisation protein MauE domain-containing protein n=1 Tax=Psychromicrobium silvestre TaxID=1645614 RepID=A0A7Y9LSE3_9MICC|nr:MauE/DoxX family redox-associated membrane protein [Psychromicrobium silvestre]NYE94739.1 hypothetical protein [Psychromicrobium silvestre]
MTLLFPAIQKFRARQKLSFYYAALLRMNERLALTLLSALCVVEGLLAVLTAFSALPLLTGSALICLFLGFIGYRLYLIRRFSGTASCGCSAEVAETTRAESFGGLAAIGIMTMGAISWTVISM